MRASLGIVDLIHFSDHLKVENYPELLFNVEDMLLTGKIDGADEAPADNGPCHSAELPGVAWAESSRPAVDEGSKISRGQKSAGCASGWQGRKGPR